MGKNYEALKRAEAAYLKAGARKFEEPREMSVMRSPRLDNFVFQAEDAETDGFDKIKLKLVNFFSDADVKSIMFAGASHCIGTSTVASNFALMLSTDYRLRVLLVNTDYRSLYESEIFSDVSPHGLSDVLTKKCSPSSAFHKSKMGNLYLLPKGESRLRPVSLLESPQFDNLLKSMREKFDYLILDAPPVIGYSDAQIVASRVDGVILVVESGKTRRQVALRAKQELEDAGSKVLGVILNKRKRYIPAWIYKRL